MKETLAHQMEDAKYGSEATGKPSYFNDLSPPYFFRAVRSVGECGMRRGIWSYIRENIRENKRE
jgi:hypothetical protein